MIRKPLPLIVSVITIVIVILLLWVTKIPSKIDAETSDDITFRMKWFFAGTMVPWFTGKEQGLFAKEGIDLTILPGGPANSSIKLVASKTDTFGVAGADEVLLARSKGIPITAIAVLFRNSPICFISRQEQNIQTPKDWKGKKVEVSYGENAEYQFRALAAKFGLKKNDIMEVPYTYNVTPFLEGLVDVSPAYAMDQAVLIENKGIAINKLFAKDFGINPYGDVIISREDTLIDKPELVRRFLQAVVSSMNLAIASPKQASSDMAKHVLDLSEDDIFSVWKASIPFVLPADGKIAVGKMQQHRWATVRQVLLDSSVPLKNTVDIESAFTNNFLP